MPIYLSSRNILRISYKKTGKTEKTGKAGKTEGATK
jgi:hypothetical protein